MKFPSHFLTDNRVVKYLLQNCKAANRCLHREAAYNIGLAIGINGILQCCKANFRTHFLQQCKIEFLHQNLIKEYKIRTHTMMNIFIWFLSINTKAR